MKNSAPNFRAALARRRDWLPVSVSPAQLLVISFGLVIAAGAVLLATPAAVQSGPPLSFLDALFTAVSATCVTGLAVVDTGTRFSVFGQVVILCCIQIGGLGLMTFTTVFLVATGRRLAIADRIVIQESFHHSPTGNLRSLILYIVGGTMATEALGAAVLAVRFLQTGFAATPGDAVWQGVFHAVSAFCNAGFALYPDSLVRFRSDAVVLLAVSVLIIAGGLGFLVWLDVKEYLQQRFFRSLWRPEVRVRVESIRPRPRLSLHSKLVLTMTASLLVVGALSYHFLEHARGLRGGSTLETMLNAWFCSVTARTAGFNTVEYAALGGPALLCTMVLMFIGGSPGSASGGVKTSTFGLLIVAAIHRWRGHPSPHVFRRSIPAETLERAGTIVIASVGFIIVASSFLMAVEARSDDPIESQARFVPVLFETFSAFGTVGLSMGITPTLTAAGKLLLCLVMFVGRVGPLTAALALAARKKQARISYAEENIMVG